MPIRVLPHSHEHSDSVHSFNLRMRASGSKWGFYVEPEPDWIPKRAGAPAWREYHLAVEDDGTVRGGYALKPQKWAINGREEWVCDWQGPFTEGAVDARYGALALRLIRDMLKKYPLLFSTGHGGDEVPVVQILESLGWTLHPTPFCLYVLKPFRFLRHNAYLRRRRALRVAQDALAWTGLGYVGAKLLHAALRVRRGRTDSPATAVPVTEFGEWADALWHEHGAAYRCLAVRDRAMMNTLLPQQGWPGGTRLKIERGGEVVGWSVVHAKKMRDDARFGSLHVAQISDCFAAPKEAAAVVAATHAYVRALGADLACSNQSHPAWVDGFRAAGYAVLEGRRLFAVSPQLKSSMEPFEETVRGLHVTNLDGHGPHGFTADDPS